MTWFKIDDGFWSHPKVISLSDAAVALWTRAGAYSCQHLTDGHVSDGACRLLAGTSDSAGELVDAGLWKTVRGGWQFHDWDEYQETSGTVKKRREQAKERQRKRRALQESHASVTRDKAVTHEERHALVTREFATPDPTRPIRDTSEISDAENREDVTRLVDALLSALDDRGCRRPSSTKQWEKSARLLLDKDKRNLNEALAVLDWSQKDSFWNSVILSMPKFREKYDQLRLAGGIKAKEDPEDLLRECWTKGSLGKVVELTGWNPPIFRVPEDPEADREAAFIAHNRTVIEENRAELIMRIKEVS